MQAGSELSGGLGRQGTLIELSFVDVVDEVKLEF